ncbi:imidazole glycerol phosphate synthase subunit HisH [Tahibacter sp. UC22_41]|uniref:imidazole glycerol phosphate synthase subunit HisH n=1 Tax=Tahibacter sp. UC22_41 TaxID=3350178 RepID=UPI0036DB0B3A
MSVVLVDGGGTNIGSVRYALQRLGVDAPLTTDAARIRAASHVILPGVGAAGPAMQRLVEFGLVDTLRSLCQPVLGVCLGMQLLFARSAEADTPCLGLIPADVHKLPAAPGLRVPHMGWNRLLPQRTHPVLADLPDDAYAYFVHGYAAPPGPWTLAGCRHGSEFSAIVQNANFFGMQFHPERSAAVGSLLLKNFLTL